MIFCNYRRLRRVKEDEWGRMPTTQKEFKPEVMDVMADGSRLLWADSMNVHHSLPLDHPLPLLQG